ncbi:MAG: hypothetical protein BWX68_02519 [Verrucomicrobia bacterium ADurb.Bin063]|nr:MAG: hypothetical protein BWX68_02519 [Verrucomicrobia bacterium ADurb.Bin063]
MGDVHQSAIELREAVAPIEKFVASGGFDDDIAHPHTLVEKHQAVFIGHTQDIAAQTIGRLAHEVDPITFTQIPRVNPAIADLARHGLGKKSKG